MPINQAQKTVLAFPSYLINLVLSTGHAYCKTLRLKAYSDILNIHLYSILDYAKVEFFNPTML